MGLRSRVAVATGAALVSASLAFPIATTAVGPEDVLPTRATAPVVLTGAHVPSWSRLAATGTPNPWPSGALDGVRDAHNGTIVVPPDARTGVEPETVAAYRWDASGGRFLEIPVQVDQRFPHFLANGRSDFGPYSGTDTELTYQWDTESWRMTAGECRREYVPGDGPMADPVPSLDDDDEIVFMASDTGPPAPAGVLGPVGTGAERQEVAVADPVRGTVTYAYLFLRDGGSRYTADDGYVRYERHVDADEWIDRESFRLPGDPEQLGSSNTGYGPNLEGTVCDDDGTIRTSTDRFPRDGVTVSTDTYRWTASGRWMVRGMQVAKPGQPRAYGPDLIDRWKGRAFQSSPDSAISLVGFEDEQVNWEGNSSLLGERRGPVRAIREVWGADSGTNVTKTETFYRDAVTYRYRLRVHPIPPDGLYTSWDYNAGVATHYFNALKPDGVAIDGRADDVGQVDSVAGTPAFFDAPDPTFDLPLSLLKWEQVSGAGDAGSLVYVFENKGPTTLATPTVVPFYRDDACWDDGTGDDPVPRPYPGESSDDPRVAGHQRFAGDVPYGERPCEQRQGAWGAHGVHYFVTGDTDNLFVGTPVPVTEVDAQQWQFAVPTAEPAAVGEPYAQEVRVPLVAVAVAQPSSPAEPAPTSLEVVGPLTGQATDAATLAARLTTTGDRRPVEGQPIRLVFQDRSYEGRTDVDGVAAVDVERVAGPARPAPVDASFPGTEELAPSSGSASFDIRREDTTLTATSRGRRLTARLTETDTGEGLSGRRVEFTSGGARIASGITDGDGRVTALTERPHKPRSVVRASFGGDDTYAGATSSVERV